MNLSYPEAALAAALVVAAGFLAGFAWRRRFFEGKIADIESYAQRIITDAQKDVVTIKKEAHLQGQELVFRMKSDMEREAGERRQDLKRQEERLIQKEETFERRTGEVARREADSARNEAELVRREKELIDRGEDAMRIHQEASLRLERAAQLTAQEAKEELLRSMEEQAVHEGGLMIRRVEAEARETANKKAREVLALAVKRYAGDYVAEHTISVVTLPNEEMKGRIIGREGRNIRAIEAATGVDLIVDDTPEAVILSSFSPYRREIARLALEKLISDGRIHPTRIEEVVTKVTEEMESTMKEIGKEAAFDVGVHGIHPQLERHLGRLRFRTSYAQNVLQHSIEVAFLCGIMAAELGQNVKQAKRAGLLHDIGKAVDHEEEGPHGLIGAEIARRHGESDEVVHAIMAHHEDVPPQSVLDVLVQAADTLSGARPGARREMLETYVKRLEDLERVAGSFSGIAKTYAIQAGREVRIIVNSDLVSDDMAAVLANDICRRVEKEMAYPGQIKVTVIRETRAVSYAK
ncbi:MAG: ribonuclease Y [Deltaproteobacteria bacterium]|jgi:ribonuclease Y|nr:ribonuclease Y [Deltaproteobacteria bacterium]